MNSQNRMNAGAEYVAYRIWGTLLDDEGIHAESLLTCLGALAGYSCQMCVRQAAALPGADPTRYALTTVDGSDGLTYFHADALNGPLIDSPLSVWALVSRTVQKLDQPLPDVQGILVQVQQTVGTSAFGIPQVPQEHQPHHLALVYLQQLWPQVLPIAQRFCRKPTQIPVLFGIALQRTIEQLQGVLNPTISANIAMESAVAMSKVVLAEEDINPAVTWPTETVIAPKTSTAPKADTPPKSLASLARGAVADTIVFRPPPSAPKRKRVEAEASMPDVRALVARVPPATRLVTIASLAFITIAGVMYKGDRAESPEPAREVRKLVSQTLPQGLPQGLPVLQPSTQDTPVSQEQPPQEMQARQEPQSPQVEELPPQEVMAPMEFPGQRSDPPVTDGSADVVIPPDLLGG